MVIDKKAFLSLESTYETFKNKDKLTKEEYRKILSIFSIVLYKVILEKQEVVKLPHGMGAIYLKRMKLNPKARQLDYRHYHQTGEVKITKRDTLNIGYYVRTYWDKRRSINKLAHDVIKYIKFIPHRDAKKQINAYIKTLPSVENYHS